MFTNNIIKVKDRLYSIGNFQIEISQNLLDEFYFTISIQDKNTFEELNFNDCLIIWQNEEQKQQYDNSDQLKIETHAIDIMKLSLKKYFSSINQ